MIRSLIIALTLAVASPALAATADPSQGDGGVSAFYGWDQAIPSKPGKLLRSEPMVEKTPLTNAASTIRILHSSTDGVDGKTPVIVSGTLYLPKGTAPKGGWPLLAWAHGTVGVADICAPSWSGRFPRDINYLNHWLAQGYAVVASDYQGLGVNGGHPYLATRPSSYSVLDSARAVQKGGFGVSKKLILIGQSQGGGVAWAAAGFAKTYAPDLKILGTVATGTPYFSPEAQAANNAAKPHNVVDATLGYNLLSLYLMAQVDPNFHMEDYLTQAGLTAAKTGATGCFREVATAVMANKLTWDMIFKKDPSLSKVDNLLGYATLKPVGPIFMGTGGKDHDVPPGMQRALVADACKAGAKIEWHLYPDFDHSGTVNGSLPDSTPFVKRAFAGEKIAGNCAMAAK
jgi:pimeloyl-ACP methyl ester carboxylesterase